MIRRWALLCAILFAAACAHKPMPPGEASWYGPGFRGKKTASGERFWPNLRRTAAHRTLPFGTVVKVERRDTGQSVRVVINDRGPFVTGRVIDLSKKAARRIDLVDAGHAPVSLLVVGCKERYRRKHKVHC